MQATRKQFYYEVSERGRIYKVRRFSGRNQHGKYIFWMIDGITIPFPSKAAAYDHIETVLSVETSGV